MGISYQVKKREGWLDLSRGFLMCLVFLYHSTSFYSAGVEYNQYSWMFTPIFLTGFFFISGYLFTSDWANVSVKKKGLQVLRVILIPYFLFMAAFLLPKLVLLQYDWRQTVSDILLLRASWFVIAIGVLQMLYAITIKCFKKVSSFVCISFVYAAIGYGFVVLYRNLPTWFTESPFLYSDAMPGCMPACVNLAFLSTPFFSLGILYRRYEEKFRLNANLVLGMGLLSAYLGGVFIDHLTLGTSFTYSCCACNNYLLNVLYFLISMAAMIELAKKVNCIKPLNYIGANSLLFYYLNILMLRVAGTAYNKAIILFHSEHLKEAMGYGNYIIVTIIAILATFPAVWLINKYLPLLTGKKEAYNNISNKLKLKIYW